MKIFFVFFFISLAFLSFAKGGKEQATMKDYDKVMRKILKYVPNATLKRGLEHYLEILSIESYINNDMFAGSNIGIENYHRHLLDNNPCFARVAEAFYRDITSLKTPWQYEFAPLSVESGNGILRDFSPGWSYDMALEYVGGPSNLAFTLLGICGHDDIGINVVYRNIVHDSSIVCPARSSMFYAAKALGEEVDISEELKTKIAAVQAPIDGRKSLPGKNYHFMGAAFMACELVGRGVSPKMTVIIQKLAAWIYRTMRISNLISKQIVFIGPLEDGYEKFSREFRKKNIEEIRSARGTKRVIKKPPGFEEWLFEKDRKNFGNLKNVEDWLVEFDAAKLLDHLGPGGWNLGGIQFPHTNIMLSFFDDPVSRHIRLGQRRERPFRRKHNNINPMGWPQERYLRAQQKTMTYLVDWEWTVTQHEIGASFAAERCRKQPENFKPDDHIVCSVCYDDQEASDDKFGSNFDDLLDSFEDEDIENSLPKKCVSQSF